LQYILLIYSPSTAGRYRTIVSPAGIVVTCHKRFGLKITEKVHIGFKNLNLLQILSRSSGNEGVS